MSSTSPSAQELSGFYLDAYCGNAVAALLLYDWLLCLNQEIRFIWSWHSKITASALVYAFSRYSVLLEFTLSIATNFPMSDRSCAAIIWMETVLEVLGILAFSAFSALRAYALSNRNRWFAAIVIFLALPPSVIFIIQWLFQHAKTLPSPFNCSASINISPAFTISGIVIIRGSQIAAELLVVAITWWYTYQSYLIQDHFQGGKSINSLLLYSGSLYFMLLSTLCVLNIIVQVIPVTMSISNSTFLNVSGSILNAFYDPITSILTCRFMISLRQFDSSIAPVPTFSMAASRVREYTASTVLQFAAQPSDTLPSFIASFAHPIHVDSILSDADSDATFASESDGSEWREMDGIAPNRGLETPCGHIPTPGPSQTDPPAILEPSA